MFLCIVCGGLESWYGNQIIHFSEILKTNFNVVPSLYGTEHETNS